MGWRRSVIASICLPGHDVCAHKLLVCHLSAAAPRQGFQGTQLLSLVFEAELIQGLEGRKLSSQGTANRHSIFRHTVPAKRMQGRIGHHCDRIVIPVHVGMYQACACSLSAQLSRHHFAQALLSCALHGCCESKRQRHAIIVFAWQHQHVNSSPCMRYTCYDMLRPSAAAHAPAAAHAAQTTHVHGATVRLCYSRGACAVQVCLTVAVASSSQRVLHVKLP